MHQILFKNSLIQIITFNMKTILTSGGGIALSAVTQNADINEISATVVQLLIGIVTLIKLFKQRPREKTTNNQTDDSL